MFFSRKVLFDAAVVLLLTSADFGACSPEMHALHERLLGNYSVYVRPVMTEKDVVHINVSMSLLFVMDLDLKAQTLKSSGFMDIMWVDQYMVWRPEDYANITTILLPQSRLWLPDLVFSNDVLSLNYFGNDDTLLNIRHDGTVTWQPDFVRETGCSVDIYKYPFDTQQCSLIVLPWMTTNQYMEVTFLYLDTGTAVVNGEFLLTGTRILQTQFDVTFSSAYLAQGTFTLTLERRYSFYLLSTVLPLAAFSLLSPLALLVPADSGEKITLSVTVLLANLVFMASLSDSMPRVADSVSVYVLYASLQILLSFTAVIVNVAALCMSRMPTSTTDNHGKDKSHEAKQGDGESGNFLSRQLRMFYLSLVSPSPKDFSLRHHPQLREKSPQFYNQDSNEENESISDMEPRVFYTQNSRGSVLKARPSLYQEEEQRGGGGPTCAPIGRRDRILFLIMFTIVFLVNVVTILVLVL
ncbi:neuronal acetylcholine receptor subunit alpha-10-like isoform X2 [Littorina saxatilis]|uniref:neuronal acetylcholine receptor subunit alpha-10-like isoform X2 n=1 Tax=Littorina saxatilis TaxID=31220 RepID=UPI0038B6A59A